VLRLGGLFARRLAFDSRESMQRWCNTTAATYQLPLLALIGIGVVFLVLVVIVVIVIIHNRRVVNQYSLLVSESAKSREMERIDSPSGADNA